jgi:hypothetical protein
LELSRSFSSFPQEERRRSAAAEAEMIRVIFLFIG